jgi:glycine dehydrogenase subunit 2
MERKLIFEKSKGSRHTDYVNEPTLSLCQLKDYLPEELLREELDLPSLSEPEVIRHYLGLAELNFSVDTNFYPLGSCTMKYNPKINESLAALEGFCGIHPYQSQEDTQGALEIMYELEQLLCRLTGMSRFSLQPSSGAQGELTGMLMIRKYHQSGGKKKTKVIIPDSAHGTNPATATMCGYQVLTVESTPEGLVDIAKLEKIADSNVAAIMLTNPNTLGLFEERILEISRIIHSQGGLLYYDGANLNPLLGITTPASMGFDVVHLNLHKTFSTPHGCGGPGAGVVGANETLKDFLPVPLVGKKGEKFCLDYELKNSIGRVRSFYANFLVLVKAFVYLKRLGSAGLLKAARASVVNANYLKAKLKDHYQVAYPRQCMHEVVFSCQRQKEKGALALDVAKRLIDFGIHPPTMYFPLIVKEALMVEPTECENKQTLDYFVQALIAIDNQIESDCRAVCDAPHNAAVERVDEVRAARFPEVRWYPNKRVQSRE